MFARSAVLEAIPRFGLLTALTEAVGSAFGRRVDRRALRNGCRALEHANAAVFRRPEADALMEELPRDLHAAMVRLVDRYGGRADALCDTVHPTDHPVPEGVILGRAAMVVAALATDVDPVHDRALQELGVAYGLWLESAYGAVDSRSWSGAWASVGRRQDRRPLAELWDAKVAMLPPSGLAGWCASPPPAVHRQLEAWRPASIIPLSPAVDGPFESVLSEMVSGRHALFGLASTYVQRQGGKRLRPRLVQLSAEAVGRPFSEELAAAVEWVHMASLVLDDIMDEASTRRGGPALHALTDAPFAASVAGWMLDSVRRRIADPAARAVLIRAGIALVAGQYEESRRLHTRSDYERCIARKTAALFAASAELGALQAASHERTALRDFGRHIGVAFQMVDDLLDVVGGDLGKPVNTDVSAGRATLPWFVARDLGTPGDRERLDGALEGGGDVSDLLTQDRVLAGVRGAIEDRRRHALRALDSAGLHTPALVDFADAAVVRTC